MKEYDKYLKLLKEKYPTKQSVYSELINLNAIMNLPKGTEQFMSDLHGEYDAFFFIINKIIYFLKFLFLALSSIFKYVNLNFYIKERRYIYE